MKSHRVFLGAPLAKEINKEREAYHWQTVSSISQRNITLLPDTIEAASRRISALYENIIFQDDDDESHYLSVLDVAQNPQISPVAPPGTVAIPHGLAPVSISSQRRPTDDTAAIPWPLTVLETTETQNVSKTALTFLRPTASISRVRSMLETQDTRASGSFEYSDASSVGRFPEFHFSIHTLTTLSQLAAHAQADIGRAGTTGRKGSRKVTILAVVLEVEGPDTIRIKKGAEAGKEVSLLKLILGDEDGCVCKLTAWRETAETWGGADPAVTAAGIKRGDIVLLENVLASWGVSESSTDKVSGNAAPVTLTASANVKSRLEIC